MTVAPMQRWGGIAMTDEELLWLCESHIAWLEHITHLGHSKNCERYSAFDEKIGCQCVVAQAVDDMERVIAIERRIQEWRRQKYDFLSSMKKTEKGPT